MPCIMARHVWSMDLLFRYVLMVIQTVWPPGHARLLSIDFQVLSVFHHPSCISHMYANHAAACHAAESVITTSQ